MMSKLLFSATMILTLGFYSCSSEEKGLAKNGDTSILIHVKGGSDIPLILEKREVSDRVVLDTLELDDNNDGEFVVTLEKMEVLSIRKMNDQKEIIFVADRGERITVTADSEDFDNSFRLAGSKEVNALDTFIVGERKFQTFADSLNDAYLKLKKVNEHYAVEGAYNDLYTKRMMARESQVKQFIDAHPERFVNIIAVRSLDFKRFPEYYKKVKESLEKQFPESEHVKVFAKDVNRVTASAVGGKAPDFELPTVNGGTGRLSDYKGKYVLLDFWATWCRPCIAEIPNLKQVYESFKDESFEVVSICVDRNDFKPNWEKIIQNYQMDWPQFFDGTGVAAQDYAIEYFPTIFLLDDKGQIIAKNLRGEEITKQLNAIFKR